LREEQITARYTLPAVRARYDRCQIDLTDLLRHRCTYSPVNCHLGAAFEALRWMYGLGWRRWQSPPAAAALAEERGVVPGFMDRIELDADWRDGRRGLPGIFDVLLLAPAGKAVQAWRDRYRLAAYRRHTIPMPATASMRNAYHCAGFGESCDLRRALERLLAFSGDFRFSPNESHPQARWAYQTVLHLGTFPRPLWQVRAHYSYHGDPGSSWFVLVAGQEPREPFHAFIARALAQIHNMCGQRVQEGCP
jgi:hypothetical protein